MFRSFIADQVFPFIAAHYPVTNDRTFIGHSYGGLFGTYILLTKPDMFCRYIIVSPSLWFDNGLLLKQRPLNQVIHARAFFAIGSLETQAATGAPMIQDLTHFTERLKAQRNVGLEVTLDVREGESHESIFPGAVTQGLLTVFQEPRRSS
jgi:predicted alpha/beta superfamily hydrolase